MPPRREASYIVEFVQVGQHVKVSAIDPMTLTEVAIIGSPRASQESLTRLAVQKLEFMLRKKERDAEPEPPPVCHPRPKGEDNLY